MDFKFTWTTQTYEAAKGQFSLLPDCLLLIDAWENNAEDLATLIAKNNFCENKNGCGTCKGCRLFKADTHPDLIFNTEPLKIDEVRDLLEKVALTPSIAKERIIFLGKIDQYLPAAINALLKTLEEPPKGSRFIISAKAKRAVMPTILSRSRVFQLKNPSYEDCKNYLITQGFTPNEAETGLSLNNGNPFLAVANKEKVNPLDYLLDFQNYCLDPKNNRLFFKKLREIPDKERLDFVIKLCEKSIFDFQVEKKKAVKITKILRLHNFLAALYRLKRPYLRQVNQSYSVVDLMFKYLEQKRIVL